MLINAQTDRVMWHDIQYAQMIKQFALGWCHFPDWMGRVYSSKGAVWSKFIRILFIKTIAGIIKYKKVDILQNRLDSRTTKHMTISVIEAINSNMAVSFSIMWKNNITIIFTCTKLNMKQLYQFICSIPCLCAGLNWIFAWFLLFLEFSDRFVLLTRLDYCQNYGIHHSSWL